MAGFNSTRSALLTHEHRSMNAKADRRLTTSAVARAADVSETFVRSRADAGLIPHLKLSDGTRVFATDAVAVTARLMAERRRA